jgi:hypothetical protein
VIVVLDACQIKNVRTRSNQRNSDHRHQNNDNVRTIFGLRINNWICHYTVVLEKDNLSVVADVPQILGIRSPILFKGDCKKISFCKARVASIQSDSVKNLLRVRDLQGVRIRGATTRWCIGAIVAAVDFVFGHDIFGRVAGSYSLFLVQGRHDAPNVKGGNFAKAQPKLYHMLTRQDPPIPNKRFTRVDILFQTQQGHGQKRRCQWHEGWRWYHGRKLSRRSKSRSQGRLLRCQPCGSMGR